MGHRSLADAVGRPGEPRPVNAALAVVSPQDREDIEVGDCLGTESSPDSGKPMSTYVQRWCQIEPNCRNFEAKHACYGGTSALMMAAHWVASGAAPGKKALVVTSDQSRTHLGQPWSTRSAPPRWR